MAATDNPWRAVRGFFRSGTAPDPRFSLAKERTLLAWLRTGVALIAAGLAVEVLELDMTVPSPTSTAATLLAVSTAITLFGVGRLCLPPERCRPGDKSQRYEDHNPSVSFVVITPHGEVGRDACLPALWLW
jgi:uncharacterized membrane protein YidH (DUF202 family)